MADFDGSFWNFTLYLCGSDGARAQDIMERRHLFLDDGLSGHCHAFVLARYLDWLNSHSVLRYLLIGLMFLAMFSILAMPVVLILMFFVEGLKVIRHEGMKPANLLSMAFSVLLFGYLTVWPFIGGLGRNILGTKLYVFISIFAAYLLVLLAVYSLSAILNLIHLRKRRKADYIIVLGAGLLGTRVTPLLAARIDKGIELLRYNRNAVLIMSGGQGPGRIWPRARPWPPTRFRKAWMRIE